MNYSIEKLLNRFEKLRHKYQAKRDFFKTRLEKLKKSRQQGMYSKCHQLIEIADDCVRSLNHDLYATSKEQDEVQIKQQLKTLKKSYKQLHELTKPLWLQWVEAITIALVLALILRNLIFGLYHVPTGSAEPNILVGDRIWGNKMAYYFGKVNRGDLVIFDNPEFDYDITSKVHSFWQKYIGIEIPLLGLHGGPDNVVKRVIALPGDVIEGRVEDNKTAIYLNGEKLDEPYVNTLPLLRVKKTTGFFPAGFPVPCFLRQNTKLVNYTYDPEVSLDDQPYYKLKPQEIVIKNGSTEMILLNAFSPTYTLEFGRQDFVYTVDNFGPFTVPEGMFWTMGDSRRNSRDSRYWKFLDEKFIHGRASFVIYSIDSEEPFWLFELIKHPIDFWTKKIRWNRFFTGLGTFNGKEK